MYMHGNDKYIQNKKYRLIGSIRPSTDCTSTDLRETEYADIIH